MMPNFFVTRRYTCEDTWRIHAKTKAEAIALAEESVGTGDPIEVTVLDWGGVVGPSKYTAKKETN